MLYFTVAADSYSVVGFRDQVGCHERRRYRTFSALSCHSFAASRRVNLIVGELGEWHVLSGPAASCKSLSVHAEFIRLRALTLRVRDEDSWPAHTCLLATLIRQVCFHLRRSPLVSRCHGCAYTTSLNCSFYHFCKSDLRQNFQRATDEHRLSLLTDASYHRSEHLRPHRGTTRGLLLPM